MRQLLITLLIFFSPILAGAQTINGVPIDSLSEKGEYVLLLFTQRLFKQSVVMDVDFGQKQKGWSAKDTRFTDKEGKPVEFNTVMDGVNYFASAGYEFIQAYAITIQNTNIYHYLMRKRE